MDRSRVGILLVGHGSHLSPDSATPIHDLVRRLEEVGAERFGEVRAAFWKEEPELRYAIDLMERRDVFVIPVFTSAGYFTERVVPRELRLDGALTLRGGRRILYSPPVGLHPGIARIVLDRAREAAPLSPHEMSRTTLVILGHGTRLHPGSSGTTEALAEKLRGEGYLDVLPAFLDQDPKLEEVLSGVGGPQIVVPFFISEGWHAGTTIPRDLDGFDLVYARAIGTHPGMTEIVRQMVEEMADRSMSRGGNDPGEPPVGEREPSGDPLPIEVARTAFIAWWSGAEFEFMRLLQVELRRGDEEGRLEIRHIEDWSSPQAELRDLHDPAAGTRLALRSTAGAHRPLRSAPDLAGGWRLTTAEPREVWDFLDRLYPGALLHRFQWSRGELPITSFPEIAARQSGIHARVGELNHEAVLDLVDEVCAPARCLRTPIWHLFLTGEEEQAGDALDEEEGSADAGPEEAGAGPKGALPVAEWRRGSLPCPESCSLFIAAAAKRVGSDG
jgi:sirohydrochlorin cobaltochelatase